MHASAPIPFEQFMAKALHDPSNGYYARQIRGVGRRGDFTTAPMLSSAPARAIATWASKALAETKCRNLIEAGPGEGSLAAAVFKHLPWHQRLRTQLHLVETSVPLAARQRELLGNRATWHRTMAEALAVCTGRAVIYSNELVDAFPVRRYQKTELGWQEMAIHFTPEREPQELHLPPAPLPASSNFLASHPLGQCIEVHDSYRRYLADWLPHWQAGRLLTIDYGGTADRLYHRRPNGTLRAYLLQQRLEGLAIYANPGRQDLTADVNFTDLQDWSRPWVSHQQLITFGKFLETHHATDSSITQPNGAGDAFLALEQWR
jgi:SAM-dependent MidA family methyltransferase